MSDYLDSPETADICLLLRAHGEQLWLLCRVLPLVCRLERREQLDEDELPAALAHLELLWIEARSRANESDAALARLAPQREIAGAVLCEQARAYHAAVRGVRGLLGPRVRRLLAAPGEPAPVQHASH